MLLTIFYEPILAGQLELKYGFTTDDAAYFYSIFTISAFATNLVLTVCPLKKHFLVWSIVGLVFSVMASLLTGPSKLLSLPDSLKIMGAGIALLGITSQVLQVTMVVNTLQPLYNMFHGQNNHISTLYGAYRQMALGFAFFSCPFFASGMTSLFSYETTCDSVAFIVAVFLVVFMGIHLSHKEKTHFKSSLKEPLIV